jgi:enolase
VPNKIDKITAEEIRDSHGNPTIEVTVWAGNLSGSFSVPSGASTGIHEAHELRDKDGKGIKSAIDKVNDVIARTLIGQDVFNQKEIDRIMIELDGTPNKDNLGGNSIIGVSIACAKVAAKIKGIEVFEYLRTLAEIKPSRKFPYLFMNLLEGGKHTGNLLAFQEYLIVPDTENISEAVNIGIKVQNSLKTIIFKNLGEESTVLGDEGGFAPKISDIKKPLLFLSEAIRQNNFSNKVGLALDAAASSFYENDFYKIDGKNISAQDLTDVYGSLVKEYNLFSIEDPFEQEDFESFRKLKENNKGVLIVGDDLTVSNKILLKKAMEMGSINAMIIKPNQIGTLTETLETMKLARENGIELIVSHRGEETNDDFIADLAFAFGCFGLKAGAPTKPERMLKYKRLIKITGY